VNLQAQLTSLKAQAEMQDFGSVSSTSSSPQEETFYNNFPPHQQEGHGFFQTQTSTPNPSNNGENMLYYENVLLESNYMGSSCNAYSNLSDEHVSFSTGDSSSGEMRPIYGDMEDLQSVAFAYIHHT